MEHLGQIGFLSIFITSFLVGVSAQFFNPYGSCPPFMCPLQCTYGYALDSSGCKVCKCLTPGGSVPTALGGGSGVNPGGDPMHQGGAQISMGGVSNNSPSSLTYNKPCINGTKCDLNCPNGYYNGPDGCQFCLCAATQNAKPASTYTKPCPGAARTCDMICMDGYETESNGCQRCKCVLNQVTEPTTQAPAATTTLSEGECQMKITECQLKYPFGFMTDNSCTMCISKDDIYPPIITEEHQPMIRLSNPCIQGFDVCRIFCATGYRTGPRSCQYCACNG